jgi:iduronate 2-sulfatase
VDPAADLEHVPRAALWTRPPFLGMSRERTVEAIQAYYACVSFVDAQVGRLLAALHDTGLENTTWIVVWSDHGYMLGQHGQWAKESFYEPSLRAPLLIVPPGGRRGQSSPRVVEFVDIFPTLVEAVGLPPPAGLDGRSLVPLLEDANREWPHPAFAQVHTHVGAGRAIRTERWAYNE